MKNLELLHFDQLKTEIEAQFLKRHTPSQDKINQWKGLDIVYFQEDLREITKGTISEKSFYTYFKAKNLEKTPRIDMLNILSQYVGYPSWHEFKKKHLFENEILSKENGENLSQSPPIPGTPAEEIFPEDALIITAKNEKPFSENGIVALNDEISASDQAVEGPGSENTSSEKNEASSEGENDSSNSEIPSSESKKDSSESKWVPSTPSQPPSHPTPSFSDDTLGIIEGGSGVSDGGNFIPTETQPRPADKLIPDKINQNKYSQLRPRPKNWLWWGIGVLMLALAGLGIYMLLPKKYAYVFRDADRGTNVQVSVLVKVNKPGESPLYFRLRPGEPFVYETREHSLNMEVSSPLYENISLTRNLDSAPDTEYILLRPDDYKSAVYYYSKKNIALDSDHAVEQLTEKRRELNRRISDDAQIYQVFDNDIYGIESLTKDQYITLVTTPTTSLRNLSFIDVKSKNGKIISIKFRINENEKHP